MTQSGHSATYLRGRDLAQNGPRSTLPKQEKRKAENAFSITEKPVWAIREAKIKAERNNKKRLSVVQRKNDN